MTESAVLGPERHFFDRARLTRLADGLAAATAASLPWSTTATAILVVAWFVTVTPTLDLAALRREIMTPAGGLPIVLTAIAALGMSWADVSFGERLQGLDGFLKLLLIPVLMAQFRQSKRGRWVVLSFLGASLLLLLVSWGLALIPGLPWRGKTIGIPVKDYISQSGVFALCAFALAGYALELWRSGQRRMALVPVLAATAFFANVAYVETSRTTLVISAVLVLIFGFRNFGWKGMVAAAIFGSMLAGLLWMSSSYLQERVMMAIDEVQSYRAEQAASSSGLRLEYWKRSIDALRKSPIIGYGTGSIPEVLVPAASGEAGAPSYGTVNPHNQIFVVAIQLGLIGTIALLAMWAAHVALFRGPGLENWIGLIAVIQLIGSSLFNSHLSDFTQGWIYVFAVGVLGGMVRGGQAGRRASSGGAAIAQR
jgi:O-antigen ligase